MSKLLKLHMGFHLEGVGIYSKYVEMEIEDVRELDDSAAQQACVTSSEPSMPKTSHSLLSGQQGPVGRRLAHKK